MPNQEKQIEKAIFDKYGLDTTKRHYILRIDDIMSDHHPNWDKIDPRLRFKMLDTIFKISINSPMYLSRDAYEFSMAVGHVKPLDKSIITDKINEQNAKRKAEQDC